MTEALNIPLTLNFVEIPFHLTRAELRRKQREIGQNREMHELWNERASLTEKKVQSIIASQTGIVESVIMNPPFTEGSDLTVKFVDGFLVSEVFVEVKSSKKQIDIYKDEYKEKLPPGERSMDDLKRHMTSHNLILINGGARGETDIEISPEEILGDSFYPQLERILEKERLKRIEPTRLFP